MKDEVLKIISEAEEKLKDRFKMLDQNELYNSQKVLNAFHNNHLSYNDFNSTNGYGYGDLGRDKIEAIYSDIFGSEDALVRREFVSATHALNITFSALLRPNDLLLSISGKPYDTLDGVIGYYSKNESSLMSFGVKYHEIDLIDNDFDIEEIKNYLKNNKVKVIEIQRSVGYSARKSLSINKISRVIKEIRKINKEVIIMVDNCYCEFSERKSPIEVGADIAVGSLIKNLGAGIASHGAYVVGSKKLINLVAERLYFPGEAKEMGPSLGSNIEILKALYFAPTVVNGALKTAYLASYVMNKLGFKVSPKYDEERCDIVTAITFNDKDKLIKFVSGIQKGSAVDSFSTPIPSPMPGYDNEIIMASGSFTMGSSIEISADAPIREPYTAYLQGGISYNYGKLALTEAVMELYK